VFHTSIWEGLELCLGGLSPPKPPVATELVHCGSPTANSRTSDAEIAITATLNTAIAISTAVDE